MRIQVWVAILATMFLVAIAAVPAFSRDDGMVDAVEVGIDADGNYAFTPVLTGTPTMPEKVCPESTATVTVKQTLVYQTRGGHDEATRQVLAGDFAKKSDVVNLASKEYVEKADGGVIASIKAWVNPKIKAIEDRIIPLTDRLSGLETADTTQNTRLDNAEKRLQRVEKEIYGDGKKKIGLVERMSAAEKKILSVSKGLSRANAVAWIALIIAVIAVILRFRLPRFPRRPRREKPPNEEHDVPANLDVLAHNTHDAHKVEHEETPEEMRARTRKVLGV